VTLRVDAERNRNRIIEAAQAAFAEQGLDVSLEAVAERAGVGIATLYRRFPGRDDLIAACFEQRLAEYAHAAEEALEADDAWSGFAGYIERICEMQSADQGLKDVLTRAFPDAGALEAHRRRGYDLLVRLIERAQAQGSVRRDLVPEDVVLVMMANAGVVRGTGAAAPEAWRRFVGLMLDGLRSDGARPIPPPPDQRQMMRAMRRVARPAGAPGSGR
jgi:AcrR family transcriptional regulator